MTDDIPTGDNFESTELAKTGRAQIERYNQLLVKHDKVTSEIHQVILQRVLDDPETKLSALLRVAIERALR